MEKKKKGIFSYFKTKRHYIIQDESFERKQSFLLSKGMVYLFGILSMLIFGFLVYLVISYTSLKKLIPGFPQNATEVYKSDKNNILKVNELEKNNRNRELWIKNLISILSEKDSIYIGDIVDTLERDTTIDYKKIIFERSKIDSALRKKIDLENKLSQSTVVRNLLTSSMNFTSPNNGKITSKKRGELKEITYKSNKKSIINSAMKGVVISKTKRNIVIQHQNNLITVYKNCTNIKVNIGEEIIAGKEIGTVADSVFRFQLWHKGNTVSGDVFLEE